MAILADPVDTFYLSRKSTPVISRTGNAGVFSARTCTNPTNKRYQKMMDHRQILNTVKILWDSLSTPERNTWLSFAATYQTTNKYGDIISIGGWQWFCRYNITLASATLDMIIEAPPNPTPTYNPDFFVFVPQVGVGWFFNVSLSISAGQAVFVQRKIRQKRTTYKPPLPFDSYLSFIDSDIEPFELASSSEVDLPDQRYFCRLKSIDEYGRTGGFDIRDETSIP